VDIYTNRKNLVKAIFIGAGILFLLRLFYIQVVDPTYKEYADSNTLRKIVQYPARGLIYDRNHELLVLNKASYDLLVTPREAGKFDTVALCQLLEVPLEEFRSEIKKAAAYSMYKP